MTDRSKTVFLSYEHNGEYVVTWSRPARSLTQLIGDVSVLLFGGLGCLGSVHLADGLVTRRTN